MTIKIKSYDAIHFFHSKIYVAVLEYFHKVKGHHTSGILFIFWLFLTFFAIPQLRYEVNNFYTDDFNEITWAAWQFFMYSAYFVLISIMVVLNCFADKMPNNSTYPKYSNPSPELSVSFLDKVHFQWFTRVAWLGFLRPLNENDLYDIHPQDTCGELYPQFEKHFQNSIQKNKE